MLRYCASFYVESDPSQSALDTSAISPSEGKRDSAAATLVPLHRPQAAVGAETARHLFRGIAHHLRKKIVPPLRRGAGRTGRGLDPPSAGEADFSVTSLQQWQKMLRSGGLSAAHLPRLALDCRNAGDGLE